MEQRQSSNREFGLVMAGAFLVFTAVSAWKKHSWPNFAYPGLSVVFLAFALQAPQALAPLNAAWSLIGKILHKVMSPIILGVLYFLLVTPFGLLFRRIKKDPLRLRLDPAAETYWIRRPEGDQPGKGMANQF
ncbi:MAG: SxtJ family membrane protein [Bdellovibrionota bacterium]